MKYTEIFSSIQGEGKHTGRLATFIRFAGCNLQCTWCDTQYAWNGGHNISSQGIIDLIEQESNKYIVITGGEPLVQDHQELFLLCCLLKEKDKYIAIETNGTIFPSSELFHIIDFWSVSPKLASSHNEENHLNIVRDWINIATNDKVQFKFVIQREEDVHDLSRLLEPIPVERIKEINWIITPEWSRVDIYPLLPQMINKHIPELGTYAYFLPQLHKIMGIE